MACAVIRGDDVDDVLAIGVENRPEPEALRDVDVVGGELLRLTACERLGQVVGGEPAGDGVVEISCGDPPGALPSLDANTAAALEVVLYLFARDGPPLPLVAQGLLEARFERYESEGSAVVGVQQLLVRWGLLMGVLLCAHEVASAGVVKT
jgi:hypothetical protein